MSDEARQLGLDVVEAAKQFHRHTFWWRVAGERAGLRAHHAAVLCQLAGRLRQLADRADAAFGSEARGPDAG